MKSDRTTGTRRAAVTAAVAALVLAAAALGVLVVGAGTGFVPAGPDVAVAPADAGVNRLDVLDPVTAPAENPKAAPAERALAEWVPTGGGKGGGSSPKK